MEYFYQGVILFLLLAIIVVFSFALFLRARSNREYEELFEQFDGELLKAGVSAEELADNLNYLSRFTMVYSLFRKARGKERKSVAKLEMEFYWEKLPRQIQVNLAKLGKEAGIEVKEE